MGFPKIMGPLKRVYGGHIGLLRGHIGFWFQGLGSRDPQKQWYLFGGPHIKDSSILGSILGSPYFGKLPYLAFRA